VLLPALPISAAVPVVVTDFATEETESTATLNATINDFGTAVGPDVYLFFDYATDGYYDAYASTYDKHTPEITWAIADGLTKYAADLTGLSNGTEYHFRAGLRYGTAYIYGADVTFNTNMIPPSTTPQIYSLKAYKNLLVTGDCLFVILADIHYATIPAIPVSRSFIWSLMDTGAEQGWNVGYAINHNGYNLLQHLFSLF
jgi:hypothetical protein